MTSEDKTQYQSPVDRQRAIELSTQRTQPPTTVPGYEPLRFLGAGAYGEVWVAVDKNTGRQVAIKFFEHRGGVDWSLLSREVEKLVFLSADRYVVQLLDVGWDSEPPYYVMEYVENGSLDDHLRAQGAMEVPRAVAIFRETAIGLSHAHAKGVLHCDIKPANILLDQDQKPRLADFGQSRLTTDQNPALGTLFYMAPEQADLEAVPDAKWDVYALGALLYCMLTGHPPHRNSDALDDIDSAANLPDRLKKYRELIKNSPPPSGHHKVRGVDRRLAQIVDRCLATKPSARYPHVLSVLEDLAKREDSQARRPLQMLGILLPLLLMLTMGLFGYRAYERAIANTEQEIVGRSREANRFAAESEARNVANQLDQRFRAIETAASNPRLAELATNLLEDEQIAEFLALLGDRSVDDGKRKAIKTEFQLSNKRAELQEHLRQLIIDERLPAVASWFITDTNGTMLAAEFVPKPSNNVIGDNFSRRTYFHGGIRDDLTWERDHTPISESHLSTPFKSTATQTYKVAISSPLRNKVDDMLGVMVLTFELGQFVQFPTSDDLCAVLIDGRENDFRGMIIQHPLYDSLLRRYNKLPDNLDISKPEFRVDVTALRETFESDSVAGMEEVYVDPLSGENNQHGEDYQHGDEFNGNWIVAAAPVAFERKRGERPYDTGLMLLVQRRLTSAIEPVERLGRSLFREAMAAIIAVSLLSVALWYFVRRMVGGTLGGSPSSAWAGGETSLSSLSAGSMHTRETLDMPENKSAVTPGGSRSDEAS